MRKPTLIALISLLTLIAPCLARAVAFNQFVGFGDSTLDTGYFRYHTTGIPVVDQLLVGAIAQGARGGFAGNGVMNTTILAGKFGLSAAPVGGGGTNYADGGSLSAINSLLFPANVSSVQQIRNYLSSRNGVANPDALYVISTGNNDLTYAEAVNASDTVLKGWASSLAAEAAVLQAAGARTILVPNLYRYAVDAGSGGSLNSADAADYALSYWYGTQIWSSLQGAGVRFVPADLDSLFKYVVRNPAEFGFTASSVLAENAPAYNAPSPYNSALLAVLTPAQQQQYLFIDGKHLTTAGQTIEADYEYSLLAAPGQMSLLAENAVQDTLARSAAIRGQIELSMSRRGPGGVNVWANAGAGSLAIENDPGFSNESGTPFGGSFGIDYLIRPGFILGLAFTASSEEQGFSTGGDFNEVTEAPSLYAACQWEGSWANAIGAYGLFQDSISRRVQLGVFAESDRADTTGQSPSLALRAGRDFSLGRISTGPVAGAVLQQVHVDGFTETGASGVTALSFGSQTRNSYVTQLGWRASIALGDWQPFAEVEWDHDWAGTDRTVTASLTSVAAPSYSLEAVPAAADWATATFGACYRINSQIMLRGGFSVVFLNPQVSSYGGELGLNARF
ncbi:MAG: autotransporter outer membrane beta-barrel domain-containing protein [Syntrophobacteraceae bacterium]